MADAGVMAAAPRPTTGRSGTDRWSGLPVKLANLAGIAQDAGLHTLVLRAPATLSWLTGARWNVPNTLDSSCFDVIVEHCDSTPTLRVLTNTIEAPRLADTELMELPCEWTVVNWWENRAERLPTGTGVGADTPTLGVRDLTTAITQLRRSLDSAQVGQLRKLGGAAAAATTRAAMGLTPDFTEYGAAAAYAAELLRDGMEPVCLFVAGGNRMGRSQAPTAHRCPARTPGQPGELRSAGRADRQRHPHRLLQTTNPGGASTLPGAARRGSRVPGRHPGRETTRGHCHHRDSGLLGQRLRHRRMDPAPPGRPVRLATARIPGPPRVRRHRPGPRRGRLEPELAIPGRSRTPAWSPQTAPNQSSPTQRRSDPMEIVGPWSMSPAVPAPTCSCADHSHPGCGDPTLEGNHHDIR